MLLTDEQIAAAAKEGSLSINPFVGSTVNEGVVSYGLSSTGYDLRLAQTFRIFKSGLHDAAHTEIDPKKFDSSVYKEITVPEGDSFLLPPHAFALGHSVEVIEMPDDLCAICQGKSTYARCGLIVPPTPIEAGWSGQVTLELVNTTSYPVRIYPGEGICQLLFFKTSPVATPYNMRSGTYQNQSGITNARVAAAPETPKKGVKHTKKR